jgi:hypothetical protein
MSWSWAEVLMERVTRGRVRRVQVLLQRRAVLCCALRLSCQCLRALCVWRVLQQTVANFEVRCCASQQLYQARRGVHSCVQAAAAARVAGGDDIFDSAASGEGVSVLCHVIADADAVNKRDGM